MRGRANAELRAMLWRLPLAEGYSAHAEFTPSMHDDNASNYRRDIVAIREIYSKFADMVLPMRTQTLSMRLNEARHVIRGDRRSVSARNSGRYEKDIEMLLLRTCTDND